MIKPLTVQLIDEDEIIEIAYDLFLEGAHTYDLNDLTQ